MATLQELERPIDGATVNALIEATPDWWKSAKLEIMRTTRSPGVEGLAHLITSPEGHREIVQATDAIFAASFRLSDLFASFDKPWKRVVFTVVQAADGHWRYTADYEY